MSNLRHWMAVTRMDRASPVCARSKSAGTKVATCDEMRSILFLMKKCKTESALVRFVQAWGHSLMDADNPWITMGTAKSACPRLWIGVVRYT